MANLILIGAIILPTLLALGVQLAWRHVQQRDRRRSPLTIKVLNLPGEGLLRAIEKHDDGFYENASMVLLVGPVVLATWLLIRVDRVVDDWSAIRFGWGDSVLALVGLVMLAWGIRGLLHHASGRRKYRQGRAADWRSRKA